MEGSSDPPLPCAGQSLGQLMPEEERQAEHRQLWLCQHQPPWEPRQGTHSNTPQPPGLQRENKTQTCCQTEGKKAKSRNAATTKPTSGETLPASPPDPTAAPAVGLPLRRVRAAGEPTATAPPGTNPAPRRSSRAASPLLTLLGSAGRASSWTLGSRHERLGASGGSCWLPRRGSPTSLFLSEKCNHFLTWALGERKAARRPPCPCLPASQASPPSPHVDGPPALGCSRQPPLLGGMRATLPPGWDAAERAEGGIPILSVWQQEGHSPPGAPCVLGDRCSRGVPPPVLAHSRR